MNILHASLNLGDASKAIESFQLGKTMINAFFPSSNKIDMHYQLDISQPQIDFCVDISLQS